MTLVVRVRIPRRNLAKNWTSSGTPTKSTGLRRGAAASVVMLRHSSIGVFSVLSFFLSPFVDVFRGNKPCIIVLKIVTLSGFRFFIFHKVIQVVFPSSGFDSSKNIGNLIEG